ncbi:MAG: TonB-dependent receptor [Candidatus Azobacteroides sp.]|nr:TonB-dependent receptor [Candidatus Azobacteroides sp.]
MIKQKLRTKKHAFDKNCISFCLLMLGIFLTPYYTVSKANPNTTQEAKQGRSISGKVQDPDGEPLIGVSVMVPKTSVGTMTDLDGGFTLSLPANATELQFSYLGYQTQVINIKGKDFAGIIMQPDSYSIGEEVVVVGYGTQKKETVTGSVATINTQDLLQSPQANISNALARRMPGLLAAQRSGLPGYDQSTIRIRGIGSFAENPDKNPDGSDYKGKDPQDPLIMVDGIETDNFNNIDPSEIESLTILKDASATAVYGVRGANGVILITTRRGALGKPKVSLSTNVAVTNFPFMRKSMNSYEYATHYEMAKQFDSYVTGSYTRKYSEEDIQKYKDRSDPIFYPDMDWFDYMLKDYGFQSQTNFNVSGGTDRVKYFISLGYFTQEGMFNTSHYDPGYDYQARYKRYNMRSNFDINLTKNLTASFDISTQIGDFRNPNWSIGGLMASLTTTIPMASPGVIDNKIITIPTGSPPIIPFSKGWNREYQNDLNGTVRLNYKMDYLLKGLSLRGAVSYKNYNADTKNYNINSVVMYSPQRLSNGEIRLIKAGDPSAMQFSWGIEKYTRVYTEVGADYAQSFGNHNVTGLILYNQMKYYDPNLQYLVPSGVQGLVGRVTYNYKSRYLAEFNIGYNGTENFAKGKRFGTFPAYSLGWIASEEPFFPQNNYLTFLKIRGSYGEVGNDKIGNHRFLYRATSYEYEDNAYFFGLQTDHQGYMGSVEGKMGNPLLTWEKAKKKNIGADIKFWGDRIGLTFDYFREDRNDILWDRGTVPAIIGAEMPAYNLGKMKNSGWDGEISYYDRAGNVDYFIKANYTYAHNVIKYMDEVPRNYPYLQRTGHRYGQFFGYVAEGLFNSWEEVNDPNRPDYTALGTNKIQPGDIRYVDINGDGKIDQDDQVPIGYSNFPEVMFGVSLGVSWKGFDISVLFQGADKVSTMPSRSIRQGFWQETGANKELLESWTPERYEQGLPIRFPRLAADYGGHNYAWSTYWLENARYVRLKNAEIGYTFRQDFLKRAGIGSVRLYVNGSNLITWCNLYKGEDPEFPTGGNDDPYPLTRVFNIGLNVSF